MEEYEQHQKIKYGDIIYIEFSSQKDRNRILKANGFSVDEKKYVEVEQIQNNDNIFYKDFINNLFIIFPKMKDDFMKNKTKLKEKLNFVKEKKNHTSSFEDNSEFKDEVTKLINEFQQTKQVVYSEKDQFLKEIGQPIFYKKDFILIHFDSQNFVKKINDDDSFNTKNSKLVLTETYSDDCIFLFMPWSSLDNNAKYVFSNQKLYICKKEKNLWSNDHFLIAKEIQIKANESSINNINNIYTNINDTLQKDIDINATIGRKRQKTYASRPEHLENRKDEQTRTENNNINNNINDIQETKIIKSYILEFTENQSSGYPFKIKICSNYIDPSSGILSFSSPVWLVCQNIERYLTISPIMTSDRSSITKKKENSVVGFTEHDDDFGKNYLNYSMNKKRADSMKLNKTARKTMKKPEKNKVKKQNNNIKITFDTIDRDNSLNNIYGLFYVEQCENKVNQNGLKMSSFVQYHKVIRFLHATTRKYLGFKESTKSSDNINANDAINDKTTGSLILLDKPDENCNWMLMVSYKILDNDDYYKSKNIGVEYGNKDNIEEESDEKVYKIKNKEILRIFHVETQKFLCFDEINNKLMGVGGKQKNDIYKDDMNFGEKSVTVQNLSLSKNAYDSDLIRLIPSNNDQSLEIRLVLYFYENLTNNIDSIINLDFDQLFKNSPAPVIKRVSKDFINNSLEINYSNNRSSLPNKERIEDKLYKIKENIKILITCFKELTKYCLNNYKRKFDITMSTGKPIFYRQQFLYDQHFLDKTFIFLKKARDITSKYDIEKLLKQKLGEDGEVNNQKGEKSNRLKASGKGLNKNNSKNTTSNLILDILTHLKYSIKLSFEFISAMCKDHSENKKIVFKEKDLFIDCLLEYPEASKCFLDIIKDNEYFMNLLTKGNNDNDLKNIKDDDDSSDNVIGKVLNHLNSMNEYKKEHLSTLSKFLITGDVGITSNQQYIFEEIFVNGKDRFLIKIKPLYNDIQLLVVFKDKNKNNNYIQKNLVDFSDSQIDYEKEVIEYLAVQLNLYADLCYGRNYVCIEKIRELFPLDHLIYHISKMELNQKILAGLINILNFVYIDIEPHSITVYPSLIKVINSEFKIERVNKGKVRSYIPLDKLNLILCLSLFILNNIKYGKIIVNSANINMIFNIIKLRLYENVVYSPMNIDEVNNEDLNRKLHNLKDEVRKNVMHGEEILINKSKYNNNNNNKSDIEKGEKNKEVEEEMDDGDHNLIDTTNMDTKTDKNKKDKNININSSKDLNSFYSKFGYKYIEFNFENPTGEEYLLFVLDRINDFFLNSLIINNIDYNTENKNVISQNFKSTSSNDILTQSNINYLMEILKDLKTIFSKDEHNQNNAYKSILKQIEKVINYILDIKKEDMSIYLLENLFKANKAIFSDFFSGDKDVKKFNNIDLFDKLKKEFYESSNINEVLLNDEYYYYQLFNHVNCSYNIPKIFSLANKNEGMQNVLLGVNNYENTNMRLLDNSLFSEDQRYQEKFVDFSQMSYFNNQEKNQSNKDLIQYKDDDYFYYMINMPQREINLDNFFMNAVIFKNLQELIIRILEMNVDDKLTKILLRMFTRLISQREELFDCIKNVLLLYKKEDLDKYYQCNLAIFELGLLAEKTEKWMTIDRVLDNIKGYRNLDEVNINEIKADQKDFFAVYLTLYKFNHMLIDKETGDYLSQKEVKLIQTIFHSFQIENILSALLREITQEFPYENEKVKKLNNNNMITNNGNTINNEIIKEEISMKPKEKENEKNYRMRDKQNNFKTSLERLIKEIFKLFEGLVHKSSPNQSIIEVIEFAREYPYFKDLGFNKLITELSYDEKYVKLKTNFLIDMLKEQLISGYFKQIESNYFEFQKIDSYKEQREYKLILKKTILPLKLMKNLTTRISDTKILGILIDKFVEILDDFNIFKSSDFEKGVISNNNYTKKNSLYLYTLQFTYYFLSIAYNLARKNQRLKEYVSTLFYLRNIKKIIIEILQPFEKEQIEELQKGKLEKSTKLAPKLKFYFKVKGIGIELYYYLGYNILFQINYIEKNIKDLYAILLKDLEFVESFQLGKENPKAFKKKNSTIKENDKFSEIIFKEEATIKDGYELVVASYRKTLYKYFFRSIFPIMNNLKSIFRNTSEYINYRREFTLTEKKFRNFLLNYALQERDKDIFKNTFNYLKKKEPKLRNFFIDFKIPTDQQNLRSETNLNIYIRKFLKLKEKKLIDKDKENEILFQMIMTFTSDLIDDIENNEIVYESIQKESKILAKHLKSKINFHSILKKATKENEVNAEDLVESNQGQEREIHLVIVFIKFIQENYTKKKYSKEINTLIELMADIIEVSPEILPEDLKGIEYNFFFKDKIDELSKIFTNHVQKFFLNNGSIEIFVKIACEGNKNHNEITFPIIIHFFNNVLEGGNTEVQKKFTQLFQTLPNSDNFFYHIKEYLNKDIFENLKNSSNIVEPKIDMENLNIIKDLLRFLQLLAENHNITLQNYLRDQTSSSNRLSYNFVNILVEYLSMLLGKLSNIHENSQEFTEYFINLYYERLLSLLDTICEFLQGPCEKNQEYLISTKIIESFDKILDEIILYDFNKEIKSVFSTSKKETENLVLSPNLGEEYYKTGRFDAFMGGEETYTTKKIDTSKKKTNQNELFSKLTDYQKSLLIFKISLVFLSIIEGRKNKDNVIKKILRDFDYTLIFKKCTEIYMKMKNNMSFFLYIDDNCKDINENELKNKIVSEAGFNLYFLIQNLLSFENEETEFKKYAAFMKPDNKLSKEQIEAYEHYDQLKEAMNFYSNNSLSIEILKDDIVFKVYCPKLPFFNGFDEKIRKNFDDNAKRTTLQTKLMSIMNEKDKIYQKIKQLSILDEFFKNISLFRILFSYPSEVQNVGFCLIVLMNLLIFIGYNAEKDEDQEDVLFNVQLPGLSVKWSKRVLIILGCIIAVFSLIKLFEFITREAIIIFKTLYTNHLKDMYEARISSMSDLEIHRIEHFFDSSSYKKVFIYIGLVMDIKVLYALAYMVFALLGIFVHNFFFAFHLIEFIISQPILQYVFRAIIDPIAQLAYTFIFFFILIYFYSLIIFYNFQQIMPTFSCDSPVICMVYIYSNTFTSGGNLGNFIDEGDEANENKEGNMVRYALDISYTIIMVWLVWQMVSGLIVDTFESLRGNREEKEDDMKSTCFICGMDKEKIEKYYPGKEGFEKHLQDHSVINYFFYTFYLEDKDSSEYSGLESYIKNEIDQESISWFPQERSLKIEEWESKHKTSHE